MTDYKKKISDTLYKFITELYEYHQTKDIKTVLDILNKLNIKKVAQSYLANMKKYKNNIDTNDESMFESNVIVIPGVNLSDIWSNLPQSFKTRVFVYLNVIYTLCEIYVNTPEPNTNEINFYEGIKSNKEGVCSVNKVLKNVKELKPSDDQMYVAQVVDMMKSMGINDLSDLKNVDLSKLDLSKLNNLSKSGLSNLDISKHLQNIDSNSLDEAKTIISTLLNNDQESTSAFGEMLDNIADELKTCDLNNGNLFENLGTVAESVREKVLPKIESGELNIDSLMQSIISNANKFDIKNMDLTSAMNTSNNNSSNNNSSSTNDDKTNDADLD